MKVLEGKVAVVTGGARGLGAALARGLADRGARVALVDIDEEVVSAAARLGEGHTGHRVDVADRTAMENLAETIVSSHGRVDLLINNAGVAVAGTFEETPHQAVEWLMGVNFWGVLHGCRAFLPHLRAQPEAHIVNVVSSFAWLGFPGKSAYAASKAAVRAFSESLRAELSETKVGVTLLFPGPLDTSLIRQGRAASDAQRDAEAEFVARRAIPLDKVVARTLRAIRRNSSRVVVGSDYFLLDAAVRLSPGLALSAVTRASRRMPFV